MRRARRSEDATVSMLGRIDRMNSMVGVPDDCWDEPGKAFLALEEAAVLSPEAVLASRKERLAGHKVLRQVACIAQLPRLAAGKVLKTELRGR